MGRRRYARIIICGGGPPAGPDNSPRNVPVARRAWMLRHRLARIERRMDETRGEIMNLDWLGWSGLWGEVHEELCTLLGYPTTVEFIPTVPYQGDPPG